MSNFVGCSKTIIDYLNGIEKLYLFCSPRIDVPLCEMYVRNSYPLVFGCRTAYEWVNPAAYGLVVVTSSEGRNLPYGRLEDILSRDSSALNCHTNDDKNAWFAIDLGLWVIPSAYTLRHARGYGRSALRNWVFQVSKDGQNWMTLYTHVDDSSLNEPGYMGRGFCPFFLCWFIVLSLTFLVSLCKVDSHVAAGSIQR